MSVFLQIPKESILYKDNYFFIIKDKYPVSPGHCLIISNELRVDYFELSSDEKAHLFNVIDVCKNLIEKEYLPNGYNIGMNCGETAGQTVMHFHCHIIPRYTGDMGDPRGGVRHCVAGKGYY
jgi:diadenosine tetraphosphate (Ap4A) HIT family hydrolase